MSLLKGTRKTREARARREWMEREGSRKCKGVISDGAEGRVKGKGKVFPYSLPSVGPGADPGVQAVSPQVT